ncbi:hypothetical protein DERF_002782 [Dermatophagoides farinae]|uniref:Uncharacterized protein n=1 Tax=Dermatophagoides farinae TaxID=6954 RepID=A0A922ID19_DERFA|nr:hypothetical protein DERF_002782 [Dermatophagoides farinae]
MQTINITNLLSTLLFTYEFIKRILDEVVVSIVVSYPLIPQQATRIRFLVNSFKRHKFFELYINVIRNIFVWIAELGNQRIYCGKIVYIQNPRNSARVKSYEKHPIVVTSV